MQEMDYLPLQYIMYTQQMKKIIFLFIEFNILQYSASMLNS